MIAVWILYSLALGTLIALLCSAAEALARPLGWATRGIWIAGMTATLGFTLVATAPAPLERWRGRLPEGLIAKPPEQRRVAERDADVTPAIIATTAIQYRSRFQDAMATIGASLARWDRVLLAGWALLTAFLGGVVVHAAFEGRRMRHALEPREILGTPVLIADGLGPSASGMRHPNIVLPRWVLDLDSALLRLVVRHEREHVDGRDPAILLAALLLVAAVPWHIPLWWCWHRLRLAIEVDCDRRVLRAHPDVRSYAQLLLLTAQRITSLPWVSRPVVTVVAPLRPHAAHLARRITAMTESRRTRPWSRMIPAAIGGAVVASLALAIPTPSSAEASHVRAIVRLTRLGTENVNPDRIRILVYSTGTAYVGIEGKKPTLLIDTLHLDRLPAITADVTEADVHIKLLTEGKISVGGEVTGAPATALSATGRHIVLLKGGVGIRGGGR